MAARARRSASTGTKQRLPSMPRSSGSRPLRGFRFRGIDLRGVPAAAAVRSRAARAKHRCAPAGAASAASACFAAQPSICRVPHIAAGGRAPDRADRPTWDTASTLLRSGKDTPAAADSGNRRESQPAGKQGEGEEGTPQHDRGAGDPHRRHRGPSTPPQKATADPSSALPLQPLEQLAPAQRNRSRLKSPLLGRTSSIRRPAWTPGIRARNSSSNAASRRSKGSLRRLSVVIITASSRLSE